LGGEGDRECGHSQGPLHSTHTAVGRFRSLVRRPGTRCLTISEIRCVVLTVLSSFLRQSCLVFTNVTRALEVFLNVMRYVNPRFTYLLTYLAAPNGKILLCCFLGMTRTATRSCRTRKRALHVYLPVVAKARHLRAL